MKANWVQVGRNGSEVRSFPGSHPLLRVLFETERKILIMLDFIGAVVGEQETGFGMKLGNTVPVHVIYILQLPCGQQ